MAFRCANCDKGVMYGHNVSHAKNRTRKVFRPNLHAARIVVGTTTRRVRLCTKCLRMYKNTMRSLVQPAADTTATTTKSN